ncbi:mitochondrial inner membrane protease subunit 1 [Amyelois transitella]|uniref:mitochondrial inner membrane protease subunit 1 n=1 Tax=Amyelois transitella TaxID=680683 RepID=UPI00067D6A69|nr:mitochondrial inner membrane protease subunit 1 [Amyelois transitella]
MVFVKFIGRTCGFAGYVLQYACVTHCTFEYLGDFVMCSGPSMEPTLESNNILFTEHISPRLQRLKRGDIVIARNPSNPKQNICKRIVGLPGDRMRGHFPRYNQVVPRGHVWLEGDNSSNSADSRVYGAVPEGLIRSRVVCRVWPLDKIASLTSY